ncbi:MAG: GAF domain-containing protein, partial [Deltaproteobacteria bacterium]|nr:GAF domain-containing protein [Deltaproteobacteria bacterium]
QALHEIGKAVSSTLDLQGMLDLLLEKVDLFLPYAASTVRLLNRETGFLEPIACRNMDSDLWKSRLPLEPTRALTATQTRRPLITRNLQADPQTRDPTFFREQGLISCLRIPLIAKDQILGAIAFYTRQEHDFGTEEIQFLTSLANQAAIAIHNAQLYEQSQAHQTRASALYEIAATVNQSLNPDEIFQGVIKKISEIFGFGAIRVLLLNPQGEELRLKAEHNRVPLTYSPPTTFRRGQGILGRIAETGEAMIFDDLQNDARYAELSHSKASKSAGLSFFAGLPIKSKTRTLGVLLCVGQSPRRLTSEEVNLINSMTHQIGTATENIRLYETAKEQALALEKSNKIKDEFLSVMSHELRTPLNVVVGYSGMLKDRLLGELNPTQQQALEKIINRANDQLATINNILFATVLETENYPGDLPFIKADSAKLRQVLQNLINNAIKFTDKGSITISTRFLPVSDSHPLRFGETGNRGTGVVEFKVADTGVGIPKEMLPVIFDRFRQVDSSETRSFGGVGLGLYIVKKFTELLGGTVEVESEVGKGSTFTVTIPVAN